MVKSRKQGRAGQKSKLESRQAANEQAGQGDERGGPQASAKLQKKVERKTNFLARVATSAVVASGAVKKKKSSGKRKAVSKALADFSSLDDVLKEINHPGKEGAEGGSKARKDGMGVGACKKRMKITRKENERMQMVMGHPQYKANPLSAITSHLQAVLPSQAPPKQSAKTGKPANQNGSAKRKQKKKAGRSGGGGAGAMEI
uniref:Ribosome biogenesis protein SLX9 n=1 Tax=Tetraselmis chuii TaxID=63592 RepID=A0A7S1X502_9CHLO|mmetsp:Transcript_28996/g.51838  ORF Transcript_28996/g.51838 Transcript_28996/m.51838 type:complete len:202 (+) Transcript_28996:199-804(+)